MKKLLKRLTVIPVGLLIAITLSACGGNRNSKSDSQPKETTQMQSDTTAAPAAKLNLNTASAQQFRSIPQVGDRMVHEFEEYRPYTSIRQFRKEIGKYVDEQQVKSYEKYIYVPIKPNESDRETMMQIPGLDENRAQELIDGRPYKTNQAFLDALASSITEEQLAKAKGFLKSN